MAIEFKCIDEKARIYGGEVTAKVGSRIEYSIPFRIDGRGKTFRVDIMEPLIPVWVAIDGGDGLPTLEEAKAFADRWFLAAMKQGSLNPRM